MTKYKSYLKSFIPFFVLMGTIIVCRAFNKDVTSHESVNQDTVQNDNSSQDVPFTEGLVKSEVNTGAFSSAGNSGDILAGIYSVKPVEGYAHWMTPIFRQGIIRTGSTINLHNYTQINPN